MGSGAPGAAVPWKPLLGGLFCFYMRKLLKPVYLVLTAST